MTAADCFRRVQASKLGTAADRAAVLSSVAEHPEWKAGNYAAAVEFQLGQNEGRRTEILKATGLFQEAAPPSPPRPRAEPKPAPVQPAPPTSPPPRPLTIPAAPTIPDHLKPDPEVASLLGDPDTAPSPGRSTFGDELGRRRAALEAGRAEGVRRNGAAEAGGSGRADDGGPGSTREPVPPRGLKLKVDRSRGGFIDPPTLAEVADFGRRVYQKGMSFGNWSAQMLRHLGSKIGPYLQAIWRSITGADFLPNSREGGALFSSGGKRPKTAPLGLTPKGDSEFLVIPPAMKRLVRGLEREGAAAVLARSRNKVAKLLSNATNRHVDTEQELFGNIYTTLAKPIQGENRAAVTAAYEELKSYIAAKENRRTLPPISPVARKVLTAWEDVAELTGNLAAAHKVQVFDPVLSAHRPMRQIGRAYIPRMFRAEVQQAFADPIRHAAVFNDLVKELAARRGMSVDAAAQALRMEAGRFQSNDFMGNLEMARTSQMPEVFYEYDLRNLASRYIPSYAERMAQIIAYGQRLGPRDSPTRPNLWDIARAESGDAYTQQWLREAEDQAVNLRADSAGSRFFARMQTLASGLLLSSPTTSVLRNILGGLTSTVEVMGALRSVRALVQTATDARVRMAAREIGAVRDNIGDFLHADKLIGDSFVDEAIRATTDKLLKFSGYNGGEVFVRSHAALTASQFAKDGVAEILKNPASRRSKEALAMFQRTGADAGTIVREAADWKTSAETRKFIRTVLHDTQGGYRFNQVPLWANGNKGRFFFQFGRWGTQRALNIWRNGISPALGETVTYKGKKMTRWDPMPLAKMGLSTILLGEAFGALAAVFFDRDRRDASLGEIGQAWSEDERKGIGLALQRAVNDVIMAGTLGIWSQPIDYAKGLKDQSRLRDPSQPPSLSSIKAFGELSMRLLDQGGRWTKADLLNFARGMLPGASQLYDTGRNIANDPLYEAQNDMRTLRYAARRWAEQEGLDVRPVTRNATFRKSDKAPVYEPIKEALLAGDVRLARELKMTYIKSEPNQGKAADNLRSSIKQSQPFRVGPYTSATHYTNFQKWAQRNLSPEDYNQVVRVQRRYKLAAEASGLW